MKYPHEVLRECMGQLKASDVAAACGISASYMSKLLSGKKLPSGDVAALIDAYVGAEGVYRRAVLVERSERAAILAMYDISKENPFCRECLMAAFRSFTGADAFTGGDTEGAE